MENSPKNENGRFRYDVCCEDCGRKLGFVLFDKEKPNYDPKDSGLICGDCHKARKGKEV